MRGLFYQQWSESKFMENFVCKWICTIVNNFALFLFWVIPEHLKEIRTFSGLRHFLSVADLERLL